MLCLPFPLQSIYVWENKFLPAGRRYNGGRIINEVRYPFDHLLLAPAEEVAQQRESCLQRSVIREKLSMTACSG